MKILPELCSFLTTDKLSLPGLLYRPGKTRKALIYLHGCGTSSIIYRSFFMNLAGQMLGNKGIAFFPFNNRGAQRVHRLARQVGRGKTEYVNSGSGFELVRDCVKDIDGAVKFLKTRGFNEFYLAGVSTGATKIVLYDYLKKGRTPFKKYIIFGGGDDPGIYRYELGQRYSKYLKIAARNVRKGLGERFVPMSWLKYPYSYQSLLDIASDGGDYDMFPFNAALRHPKHRHFREFAAIKKPALVVYGDRDEVNYQPIGKCLELLKQKVRRKANFTFETIANGDHGCSGKEKELFLKWIHFLSK